MRKIIDLKNALLGLLFLCLVAGNCFAQTAPDFLLKDTEGKICSLSDYKNEKIIVFFWSVRCYYCVKEIERLKKFQPKIKKDGWKIVSINVGDSKSTVESFIRRHKIDFQVLLDSDLKMSMKYGIYGVPTFFFLDKKHDVEYVDNYFSVYWDEDLDELEN